MNATQIGKPGTWIKATSGVWQMRVCVGYGGMQVFRWVDGIGFCVSRSMPKRIERASAKKLWKQIKGNR